MKLIVLLSISGFLSLSCTSECAAAKRKLRPVEERPRLTALRAAPPSYLIGGKRGQSELCYVSVRVSNIGEATATDIQVILEGVSGLSFPLKGPKKLSPHASSVYTTSSRVPAAVVAKRRVITSCGTCRR